VEFNMQFEIKRESRMEDFKIKVRIGLLRTNLIILKELG